MRARARADLRAQRGSTSAGPTQVAKPGRLLRLPRRPHSGRRSSATRRSVLRGFVNVCRHRGHEVVVGRGQPADAPVPVPRLDVRARRHACATRRAPTGSPDFPKDELSLVPVQVDIVGAVRLRQPRPATAGRSPRCSASSPRSSPRAASTSTRSSSTSAATGALGANWKVAIENYLECYHCPVAHPGLQRDDRRRRRHLRVLDRSAGRRASARRSRPSALAGNGKRGRLRPARRGARGPVPPRSGRTARSTSTRAARTCRSTSGFPTARSAMLGFSDQFFAPDVPARPARGDDGVRRAGRRGGRRAS